jgi:hypothetical protein
MRRQEIIKPLSGLGVDPTAKNPPARKCQRVHAGRVDHGEFHVTIKWRGIDRFPVHDKNQSPQTLRSL